MVKKIYITGLKLIFPGNSTLDLLLATLKNKNSNIEFKPLKIKNVLLGQIGTLKIEEQNPYFPPKAELKIMREDVLAATISIQELIDEAGLKEKNILKSMNLYIANGSFIENLFDTNVRTYKNFKKAFSINDPQESQAEFYRVSPPLLGLNTLTNASESYAAQFAGINGENTTFGNTSMSGYYSISEAVNNINSGKTSIAIVGASNNSNISSFLTHRNYIDTPEWKESPGSIFILLESEENVIKSKRTKLGEISVLMHNKVVPSLFNQPDKSETDFKPTCETLIYSDTFSHVGDKYDEWEHVFTLDDKLGNTGAASVLLNIASALSLVKEFDSVDCIDTDMFNRSSFINISKCNYG